MNVNKQIAAMQNWTAPLGHGMGIEAFCLLWDEAKELWVRMWNSQKLKEFPELTADLGVEEDDGTEPESYQCA